ncbi:hypothetical protein BH11ARM1_BH11ARM1_02140 [soil metagenome]
MNALATIVASYGMLSNSTAVVIGAMIIATLLGPIMGLALALVDGDIILLRTAALAEVVGVALVVTVGFLVGKLHVDLPMTAEILSRTKPNLLDLAIALAGGAAGAYATVSPRLSVGLVGVAISTALVPPLAATGICLAHGLTKEASGAFVLFFTNLVAIQVASSMVLFAFGFHKVTTLGKEDRNFRQRVIFDGLLFLALFVFLYFQLTSTVRQQQFQESVKTRLEIGLQEIPGAYLTETRFLTHKDVDVVVAVVTVPNSIIPEQTAKLESSLPRRDSRRLELHVRSLLTKETTSKGYLHELQPTAPPVEIVDPYTTQPAEVPDLPANGSAEPENSSNDGDQ